MSMDCPGAPWPTACPRRRSTHHGNASRAERATAPVGLLGLHGAVAQVQAPLGIVMLGISALLCALFIVYLLFQQAGALLEARRYAKEMKAQEALTLAGGRNVHVAEREKVLEE